MNTADAARSTPRLLVLIGSGEMAPLMARVHRSVISRFAAGRERGAPVKAAVLDTPYGFQENADALSAEALDFFRRRLGMATDIASLRRADEDAVSRETAYARVREADFVFSGPGSPSYALTQWAATEIPTLFADKLLNGGALVMASAAALTLGRVTAPVYEMYKAGEDPRWLPGLDVLSAVGINAAVIPHWDNSDGSGHDTRYCFMGERRLKLLERELAPDVFVLGIDEHTALVVDLDARSAVVRGRGKIAVRRSGLEMSFPADSEVPFESLTQAKSPTKPVPPPAAPRSDNLAAVLVSLKERNDRLEGRAALVEPLINELLSLRAQARAMAAYDVADQIRDVLTSLGIEVTDAADGSTDFHLPD